MAFNPGQILVFSRAGARLGVLTSWSVTAPRSYALNDIEDFGFHIPLNDEAGNVIVDTTVEALLARDNIIYVENEIVGLPGWGGAIDNVLWGDERVEVKCLGGMSLIAAVQTEARLEQSGGLASAMAQRIISAANAKKGAHGDLQLTLIVDGSRPLYGTYSFEGDCYAGISALANDTLCEYWAEAVLGAGAASIGFNIHWDHRVSHDHSSIVIHDGDAGPGTPQLASGSKFLYSGLEVLNRIRLRGTPTHLTDYLDYDCIKSVIKEVTPEVEYSLDGLPTTRLREDLTLSVNFGLSDDMQRQIATTGYDDPLTGDHRQGIQEVYVEYYKTFLYAYHNRQGKPFLEGYDWSGPDGSNDKKLTERYFRTWNKLGRFRGATVLYADTDGNLPNVVIDEWLLDTTINPLTGNCVAVALDWGTLSGHWLANGATGELVLLDADNVTTTVWGTVASAGEQLLSVATDVGSINEVWCLVKIGSAYHIRSYDVDSNVLLSEYTIPAGPAPNDIAVDFAKGLLYVVGTADATVHVYDINSGLAITPDPSFASGGGNCRGISVTGGIAYVIDSAGVVRMLFTVDGTLAGTLSTGLSPDAIYADFTNRRIWVVLTSGTIDIFHAYVAIGSSNSAGGVGGAPGFDSFALSQFAHIVAINDHALTPASGSTTTGTVTYTVRSGDTLWGIAAKFYGAGSLWRTIYAANKAYLDAITVSHGLVASPHWIFPGEVITIPGKHTTPPTTADTTKYFVVHQKGHWEQNTIPGPIGQPDQIQREWILDGDQIAAFSDAVHVKHQDPAIVIAGEEGRVCDWNPTLDGYGLLRTNQQYRTRTGHTISAGPGWYPREWDVPDRAFEPPPKPYWPEGLLYAADYLAHKNREVTVQQIVVVNADNLWGSMERGGLYTVQATKQGPRPSGITLVVRALKFSPNEVTGTMEMIAEVDNPPAFMDPAVVLQVR